MEAAAAFLAVRPRSEAETRQRLVKLGYPEPLVEEVLTRLVEMHYLDDEEFARAWIESRDRARPRGTNALRRELALKGVARTVVDELLAERAVRAAAAGVESADREAARALLERRSSALLRVPDPVKRRQRAYALLARYGFDPETCRDATAALFSGRTV